MTYDDPASLEKALESVERLLLISAFEMGNRAAQHKNALDAAKAADVGFIAYTSILKADTSLLGLASEHRETEAAIKASGVPYAFLRNGWYTEHKTASITPHLSTAPLSMHRVTDASPAPRGDHCRTRRLHRVLPALWL